MGDKGGGKSDVTDAWVGSGFQKKQPIGMPWHGSGRAGSIRGYALWGTAWERVLMVEIRDPNLLIRHAKPSPFQGWTVHDYRGTD